jgi:hypothetical protein
VPQDCRAAADGGSWAGCASELRRRRAKSDAGSGGIGEQGRRRAAATPSRRASPPGARCRRAWKGSGFGRRAVVFGAGTGTPPVDPRRALGTRRPRRASKLGRAWRVGLCRASTRVCCRCGLRAPRHDAPAAVALGPVTGTAAAHRAWEHGRERRSGRNTPVPSRDRNIFWAEQWCLDGCHPRTGRRRRAARPPLRLDI